MPADEKKSLTTQVFEVYIKASPETVWDAITSPEWTKKYGYQGAAEFDLRPGGVANWHASPQMRAYGLPDVIIDGEVIEAKPPNKLVHTYRFLFTPEQKAEGFTRITWEVEPAAKGFTRLTVIHELEGAPMMAAAIRSKFSEQGGGGWAWILSDLKSLLETGKTLSE